MQNQIKTTGYAQVVGAPIAAAITQPSPQQSHLEAHGSVLFTGIKHLEELVARAEQNAARLLGAVPEAASKSAAGDAQATNSVIERLDAATKYFHALLARLHFAIERLETL